MTEIVPVEVTMHIPATPEDLFPYFTDPACYVRWMGSQARLEPVPGGVYRIRIPDGFEAAGEFLQASRPHQVIFTWGFADDDAAQCTKHGRGEAPSGCDTIERQQFDDPVRGHLLTDGVAGLIKSGTGPRPDASD